MGLLRTLPRYEPFSELSTRRRAEIALGGAGYSLFRDSLARVPLSRQVVTRAGANPADVCELLHKGEEVIVSVDLDHCYVRQVSLPKTAAGKIGQILDLDLAHVTPFAPGSVFSAWINHGSISSNSTLNIEHIIIRKDIVAGIIEAIRNCGAKPIGIFVRDGVGAALPLALAVDGKPFRANAMTSWTRMAAASLVIFLLSAATVTGVVLMRQSHMLALIDEQSAVVQKDAADVRSRLEQIKAQSTEISGLQTRKVATAGRLEIIEELSRILPDTAHLDGVSIESNRLVADGSAATPEHLISALESSSLFENVAFSAPVFRNPGEEKSHFSIRLELEAQVGEGSK